MKKALFLLCIAMMVDVSYAQCTKDIDCKGDRICVNGECVDQKASSNDVSPATIDTTSLATTTVSSDNASTSSETKSHHLGWGNGGAVFGFVAAAVSMGLYIGAAASPKKDPLPSAPLGGSGSLITVISAPIVFVSGASERQRSKVRGVFPLRIIGWVTEGLSLGSFIGMMTMGFGFDEVPDNTLIIATGIAGSATLLSFSIDALVSRSQNMEISQIQQKKNVPQLSLGIGPAVSSYKKIDGGEMKMILTF